MVGGGSEAGERRSQVDRPAVAPPASPDRGLPQKWLIFSVVAVGLFMVSTNLTIVATALAAIERDLRAPIQLGGWIVTIYALGQITMMPVAGKLGQILGRKRVLLAAVALFAVMSLFCALSDNIYELVAFRAIQALGGGAVMPSASGIVADVFGAGRDRAIGLFSSIFPLGGVAGPVLGGTIVTYWSWHWIFFVNVPTAVVLLAVGAASIPGGHRSQQRRFDVVGIALLVGTILLCMIAITELGNGTSPINFMFIVPAVAAVVVLLAFVNHARHAPEPFVPLRFLAGKHFGTMNLINFLYGSAALGFSALVPLYAQERFGLPALQAGTLLTARAIGMMAVSALTTFALRRVGYRLPMLVGFCLTSAGLFMLFLTPPTVPPYVWLGISAGITGLGMGMSAPASNNAILQLVPAEVGSIAGLRGMFRQGGSIFSVSIVTAVVARSTDPGIAFGISFVVFAAVLLAATPLILRVPEHRGSW